MVGGRTAAARRVARRSLDQRFDELRHMTTPAAVPRGGWVRTVREALGMSAADLAARMGVAETAAFSLERNERAGRARLDTLRRAADAMDCDLVYALVPRLPLNAIVDARAHAVAASLLGHVPHSMALEDQQVPPETTREQLAAQAARLLDQPGLWRDA